MQGTVRVFFCLSQRGNTLAGSISDKGERKVRPGAALVK